MRTHHAESDTWYFDALGRDTSRLGFGGHPVGGHGWGAERDDDRAFASIMAAVENGITFFDTADIYGLGVSEEIHRRVFEAVPEMRDKLVLATKGGVDWDEAGRTRRDSSRKHLMAAAEASLRRLGTDCIDLYYMHWQDGVTPLQESVEALVELRDQGKVRAIGLSNVTGDEIRAMAWAQIDSVQVKGNLLEPCDLFDVMHSADEHGIAVVCYSGLADGLLAGRLDASMTFPASDHRSRYPLFQSGVFEEALRRVEHVKAVAKEVGKTPAQVAQRWLLDSGASAIVLAGSTNPDHVRQNCSAMGWTLPTQTVLDLARTVPMEFCDSLTSWLVGQSDASAQH